MGPRARGRDVASKGGAGARKKRQLPEEQKAKFVEMGQKALKNIEILTPQAPKSTPKRGDLDPGKEKGQGREA